MYSRKLFCFVFLFFREGENCTKKLSEKMNTYIQNAKEKNSHVIQLCKGLSFAEQKPLTCLRSCYNTYKFLKRNEKSLFMMGESQTEHIIGKKWSIKVEHVIWEAKA